MLIIITTQRRRKTSEEFFNKIYTSHFIARVRKGCSMFACERELEIEQRYFDPTVMTIMLCLSCFLVLLNRRPRGSLCSMLAFFIFSYQHLLRTPNSIGRGFPYHTSSPTVWNSPGNYDSPPGRRTQLKAQLNSTGSSNSTQLYNRSTPTRSLKSNV